MSLTNRNSGTHFLTLSAYNRFRMFSSRRSDSSISDAESIQSEQGSTGDCLPTQRTEGEILSPHNLKAFTFKELKSATRNFRPDSFIGEGVVGYVFKGWIDEQTFTASKPGVGIVVAVKKFKPEVFHGRNAWLTEVRYLGQLHHPNLVKLIGFCSDGDNRLLVYEFMPRGSLDNHLFGRGVQSLSWATRIKVAIGAAKGLTFLHDAETQVIHRNVNSASILLDSDFNAKLSGFTLAMARPTGYMTDVKGTSGYAAPEYIATGRLSARADVYNFGVVLLELLSGRRAFELHRSIPKSDTERKFLDSVRPYLGDKRKLFHIMDPKLEGQYPMKMAHAMAKLVLACIDNDPKFRPCMSEVSAVLEKFQTLVDNETAENLSPLNVQNL